jgi:hypothetical protein
VIALLRQVVGLYPAALPGRYVELADRNAVITQIERLHGRTLQPDESASAARNATICRSFDRGAHGREFERGFELDPEAHLTGDALQRSKNLVPRAYVGPASVLAGAVLDGHAVPESNRAARCLERGDQDVAVLLVFAPRPERAGGPEAEVPAASVIQDPAEHRVVVKVRETAPVDRAFPRDKRSRMTVPDDGVVRDRRVRHNPQKSVLWEQGDL